MFIADALRKGHNLLETLHGGSVASNALIYCNRASPGDHDIGTTHNSFVSRNKPALDNNIYQRNVSSRKRKSVKFKIGYCFRFKHTNNCEDSDCPYKHICHQCDGSNHGFKTCPQN